MKLTKEQKKILHKKVHFTKIIYLYHKKICDLVLNPDDNNLYYVDHVLGNYTGRATENPKTWKISSEHVLYEMHKSGFVASIFCLSIIEKKYPANKKYFSNAIYNCRYKVKANYDENNVVWIARVFLNGNDINYYVPLDCIKEYSGFCDGKETEKKISRINEFLEMKPLPNTIKYNSDGSILIEGKDFYLDSDFKSQIRNHGLLLDVKNRSVQFLSEKDDEWFQLSDTECKEVIAALKKIIKEEYGFEPSVTYGATNFDTLVNFTNYPFAPEINEFSKILGKSFPVSSLKNNTAGVRSFIESCGIPYSPAVNKIFLLGHRKFAQFLAIWGLGYRNLSNIEKIMNIDKEMFFAEIAYKYGRLGVYSENSKRILGFHFVNMKFAVIILSFLTRICDEKSSIKLISELFEAGSDRQENFNTPHQPSMLIICDTYIYLCLLFEEKALSSEMINKIVKEGFTKYNHDMLMNMWNGLYPSGRKFIPVEIQYSATERGLEFETEGFMFCLPNNTEKLIDIGAKMNICVGQLYREKAVKKSCTIVYVEKDHEYVMCIELTNKENQFSIVQASEFSNQKVRGKNLEVLKEWIKEKKIKMGI